MSDVIQNVKIRYIVEPADLSQVDANLNKLTASELKLKDGLKQVDTQAKVTNKTLQDETQKSAKSVSEAGKSFDDLSGKVKNLSSQIPGAFQVEQVLGFAKAATSATSAVGGTSAAMNVLKVAFASTGIGLLVIALVSLVAYFQKTDEGATKLEGILGAVGAAMDEVTGFVAEFGSEVFKAFESVDNFQDGLKDLGEFLVNNLFNRLKAFLVFGEAFIKFFKGDFAGAAKTGADAVFQFTTGIEGGTDKLAGFAERLAAAAKEAYEYALKLDAINDAQRELNVVTAQNEQAIARLIIQSKNRTVSEQDRIKLLDQASKLEEANLNNQLNLENKRLALIQERNAREKNAINQRLGDDIAQAKTEAERIKLREKALSIADDLNDEEANQRKKIIDLNTQSLLLQERIENRRDALVEGGIQKRLALIKTAGTAEETIYKEQYAKREIDEKQFQEGIQQSQLDSLYTQKAYLLELGRETVEIDKSIADILAKQRSDEDKDTLEKQKKTAADLAEAKKKEYEEDFAFYSALSKKKIETEKAEAEQVKQIKEKSNQLAMTIANGFFQLQKDNLNNQLSQLQYNQSQELAAAGNNEQAKASINAKFAKETAEIKRKQAVADKEQAIFNIGISTASAVIKQLAATPLPAGAGLIALVAAIGAAQLAFAIAKPIPKFYNKGTKSVPGSDTTRDSVHAMLTPGEGVMPVDRMKEYRPAFEAIFDRRIPADLINSIAMNPSILNGRSGGNNDSSERLLKSIDKKLDKIKTFEVSMDAKGFKSYLKSENSKTEIENNYARIA